MLVMKLCTQLLHIFFRQISQHFTIAVNNTVAVL